MRETYFAISVLIDFSDQIPHELFALVSHREEVFYLLPRDAAVAVSVENLEDLA